MKLGGSSSRIATRATPIGEIAEREGKHAIDAMLDVAVAGEFRVGFDTPLLETPPENMAKIANSPMALPGVGDGGAHTHGEGLAEPRDFLRNLRGFSDADVRKIMSENASALTLA